MKLSWTISRYIAGAVVPYFLFSWLLLSVILFVQQGSRFSDIFFSSNIPTSLIWQLSAALIPNVIAFTCPMAVLVGVIIGLTKMQGDSELIAIRAAGVGNLQITLPVIFLGLLLSAFTFAVNIYGVPLASAAVRGVAMRAAIHKLESPIEPGVFNSEVAGFTIYVRKGDLETGEWENVFIHTEDGKTGDVRLITSKRGRIDSTGETSELVLENAVSTAYNLTNENARFVSENIGEFRFVIRTRRDELIKRVSSSEITPEELGLGDLSRYAGSMDSKELLEAGILWQRRIILSLSPFIFCLLGTSIVLRFNRGGRGFGILVALLLLIGFYLFTFLGEQLARLGRIGLLESGMIPLAASLFAILWFNFASRMEFWRVWLDKGRELLPSMRVRTPGVQTRNFFVDLTTGLRDFDLLINLVSYYVITLLFLATVFIVFTAFELWKFAGLMEGGPSLLGWYILYLLPFIYLQLSPTAAMIGVLATYVIKSRQNEIVTWTAAGQSIYRLLVPAFILMLLLGIVNVFVQEYIAPKTNQVQDDIRNTIRSRGKDLVTDKRYWIANDKRIYSFVIAKAASDNEKRLALLCSGNCPVTALSVYEFDEAGNLQTLYRSENAKWQRETIVFEGRSFVTDFVGGQPVTREQVGGELAAAANPMLEMQRRPSHLTIGETQQQIQNSEAEIDKRNFGVALEKKYTTLILPCVIALFTAPFALSLSRKGKVTTVGMAVGLWLIFMGVSSAFEQFGLGGSLTPRMAVWAPLVLFGAFGVYLLSRVRT